MEGALLSSDVMSLQQVAHDKERVQFPPHPQMWSDLSYQCPAAMEGLKKIQT